MGSVEMDGRAKLYGLRGKIVAWSFFPTLFILVSVAMVTFIAYQKVTEDLVLAKDRELTRLAASQLAAEMKNYSDLLAGIANTSDLRQPDPGLQSAGLQRNANQLVVFDGGVVILDTFGEVVAAQPDQLDLIGVDWSGWDFFSQILHTNRPVFSNILPAESGDGEAIITAVPILGDQGELIGVLAGMFRMGSREVSSFYGGIVKLRLGDNGSTYIVDSRGRAIYHPISSRIGEDLSQQSAVQEVISGDSGAIPANGEDGGRIVAGFAPIPGTPWGLVHEESWVSLTQTSLGYRQFLILLMVLGVLVPVLVVTVGVKRIVQPINALIEAAQEVAQGNFDQTITADTGDEVEELARQFSSMAGQLQASYSQLEQRVADRTKELDALYRADEVLLTHLQLSRLLEALVDVAVDILKADKSSLLVWEPEQDRLVVGAACGFSPETLEKMTFSLGEGVVGEVMASGEAIAVEDTRLDPRVARQITDPEDIRAFMHAPIKHKDRVFGVFNINYTAIHAFSDDERRLFIALAQRAALAIENAQLYEQAQLAATVEERQRLARELHDAVTQTLFSSSLIAEVLPRLWERNPDQGLQRLEELRQLTRGALAEMRTLLMELRPAALVEAELGDLLRQLGEAFTGRSRLPVDLQVNGGVPLPPEVKVGLYRITQEALNNIAKHADACRVSISLCSVPEEIAIYVRDDGRGFDLAQTSAERLGLRIMRERAAEIGAELSIESAIGAGTQVTVRWKDMEA